MKMNQFQTEQQRTLEPPCQAERKAAERSPPDLTSMMSSTGLEAQLVSMSTVNWFYCQLVGWLVGK